MRFGAVLGQWVLRVSRLCASPVAGGIVLLAAVLNVQAAGAECRCHGCSSGLAVQVLFRLSLGAKKFPTGCLCYLGHCHKEHVVVHRKCCENCQHPGFHFKWSSLFTGFFLTKLLHRFVKTQLPSQRRNLCRKKGAV